MDLEEKKVNSTQVYDGILLKVFKDEIVLPNGKPGAREYIKHNGAVCIVPVFDDGRVIIEDQFRYPMGEVMVELPAGKLDSPDEDHLEAAKRELREETGYTADNWTYIGPFAPTVAYSTEVIYLYLATGLKKGNQELDDDEFINVKTMKLNELVEKAMNGDIQDGKTIAAVLKAARILEKG